MRSKNLPELRMRCRGSPELRVKGWEALLHVWGSLLDYYDVSDQPLSDRDIAYWYGEQALNGLLAAAAWKIPGGWSLQEFTGETRSQVEEGYILDSCDERSIRRRGDMWLGFEDRKDSFIIEAKMTLLDSTVDQAVKKIEGKLKNDPINAHEQLATLYKTHREYCEGSYPMAVVYAVPWLPANSECASEDNIKRLFSDIPKKFADSTTLTVAYQCRRDWPTPTRYPTWTEKKYGDRIYPGVIFIGRYWSGFTGEDF